MNAKLHSYMLLLCYTITYSACAPKLAPQATTPGQEITDERGKPQLLGKWSRQRLEQAPYDSWFIKNYSDYTVDSATANRLRSRLADKSVKLFMGTWCGDSQREIPRIFKILDYCGIDSGRVQLVMVSDADSTYKQSPGHEERGMNIFRVPDLIVLDRGKEMGRIVESPVQSLEKDLLALTGGENYTPHYEGAALLIKVFREEKRGRIERELPELAARIKPMVSSPSELKSYAHVLRAAGEPQKADIALQINALIFPAGRSLSQ
ncbi:MAG TPA: thioredoxin family protein [Puia sp.]|nr:thioredoxin family protein [Puia sp.]